MDELKITIRNNRILSKIESLGYVSVRKFCKQFDLDYQRTTEIINGKLILNDNQLLPQRLNNKSESLIK